MSLQLRLGVVDGLTYDEGRIHQRVVFVVCNY